MVINTDVENVEITCPRCCNNNRSTMLYITNFITHLRGNYGELDLGLPADGCLAVNEGLTRFGVDHLGSPPRILCRQNNCYSEFPITTAETY